MAKVCPRTLLDRAAIPVLLLVYSAAILVNAHVALTVGGVAAWAYLVYAWVVKCNGN